MAPGVKKSCTSCQQRHIKCDATRPACGPCALSGRVCCWVGVFFFRHDSNPSVQAGAVGSRKGFAHLQKWVNIPKKLHFVDETTEMRLTYTESCITNSLESDGMYSAQTTNIPSGCEKDITTPARDLSPGRSLEETASNSLQMPQVAFELEADNRQTALHHETLIPLREEEGQRCGLRVEQEIRLVRYFIEKLSSWFDLCDLEKHFATVAPRRALTCPTLLYAICAVSARHMSRTTDQDPLIADHYCQLCLSTLIPALHRPDLLKNENTFSAIVILRLFEELEASHNLNHLLGIQALLDARADTELKNGLGRAAFQVAMRQEIGMAFAHQRPVLAKLMEGSTNLSLSPACESLWAYRSSIYLALVLEFCYGSECPGVEKYQELVDYHQKWVKSRPLVFEPVYVDRSGAAEFPTICYLDDIHVITANNYTMAQLLLITHDPRAVSIAENRRQGELVQEEVEYHIRELCGTAFSNVHAAVAILSASSSIIVFGGRFSEYETQVLLLDTLTQAEKQLGWPTRVGREKLIETWGWRQ